MDILLIDPNRHNEYSKPPLGLLAIGSLCKQFGHNVEILDATLFDMKPVDISRHIGQKYYDFIGITTMTPFFNEAVSIAKLLKLRSPGIKIILGGPHATIFPDECANLDCFDSVVVGEGENVILGILENLSCDIGIKPIYWNNDHFDINNIDFDYSLLNISEYKPHYPHGKYGRWISAITSYGCPYNCSFCSKAVHGNKYRALKSSAVIYMIEKLQNDYGIMDIWFCDDIFTLDRKRLWNICNNIINRGIKINWECESHINAADLDILTSMQRAGCHTIWYGIETGSQRILDNIKKGIDLSQVRYAVSLTKKAGLNVAGYFMLGTPGESWDTIEHTIQFAQELGLDHAQFSVFCPMPGSAIYNDYIKNCHIKPDWHDYQYLGDSQTPVMMLENGLNPKSVLKVVNYANSLFDKKGD